ncbi:MAG TPA: lipocalin-like domain-containing protein [Geminicoccaceae bacterium]|mgnify:CR=1 FL=1|nr:lipocalin-like domain-containing protein [Geminicoccus sp.]HMU49977.1 lipocalin-like domain-containing protein [Geminicoccaceae bacterium]
MSRDLVGTWELRSFLLEDAATGERRAVLGQHPNGFLVLTAEGRLISVVTAERLPWPRSDADRALAYASMLAYSGLYRIEGDRFITEVDVAWDRDWVGTRQIRFWWIDGDLLSIETAPQLASGDGRTGRGIVVWRRAT